MAVLETIETRARIARPAKVSKPPRPAVPIVPPAVALHEHPVEIPDYMKEVYDWAYLNPRNVEWLDHDIVVSTILWGNRKRLQQAAFEEFRPGQTILQTSHVYGSLIPRLAEHIGPRGSLDVIDIAPVQLARCRRKLVSCPWARVRLADARDPGGGSYDAISCYFLLHEVPDDYKRAIVDALLARVKPGGKVVFMEYHEPEWWHPLKAIMSLVFDALEPFAKSLWRHEIRDFAADGGHFTWADHAVESLCRLASIFSRNVERRCDAFLAS